MKDFRTIPVGEIATSIPGATRILRKYHIDFCCGGKGILAQSVDGKFVSIEQVVAELVKLDTSKPLVQNLPYPQLIELILNRFHQGHRAELPELIQLAEKVESVHASHPLAPIGLCQTLQQTLKALDEHMLKEEEILFPAILAGDLKWLSSPIHCMESEHQEHGLRLQKIEALCHHFNLPDEACATWQALYIGVRNLVDEIMEHISTENNVLFPKVLAPLD